MLQSAAKNLQISDVIYCIWKLLQCVCARALLITLEDNSSRR